MTTAKRIGRPLKPAVKGKRVSLGLKVTAEVKRRIDSAALASGRTQSQEAESLIERALQLDKVLAAMKTSLAEMEKGSVEATLSRLGYTQVRDPHGSGKKAWAEPGFPDVQGSRFIPPEEDK